MSNIALTVHSERIRLSFWVAAYQIGIHFGHSSAINPKAMSAFYRTLVGSETDGVSA